MSVLAAPNEKLEAAKYFETCEKPQFDKAVILYEKAGYIGKAVDLAFETNQHNVLQFISSNFNESTEPLLLEKTASFFRYEQNIRLPIVAELYAWQIAEMEKAGAAFPGAAVRAVRERRAPPPWPCAHGFSLPE